MPDELAAEPPREISETTVSPRDEPVACHGSDLLATDEQRRLGVEEMGLTVGVEMGLTSSPSDYLPIG